MTISFASKILLPLALTLASGVAGAACVPVIGSVKLQPLASCNGLAPVGDVPFLGQCFSVQLSLLGFPVATGYAGPTSEPIIGATGVPTVMPAVIPVSASLPVPRQSIQTARSVVYIGTGKHRTALYSNDVIVAQVKLAADGSMSTGAVTEQILISGSDGKGAYAKVTGHLNVLGNSIGTSASVTGKLCLP